MLTGVATVPAKNAPDGYSIALPTDGVLVDDPGDRRDITRAIRAVFEVVFGERADAMFQEAADVLAPKRGELQSWLVTSFFDNHRRRHSKGRGNAPLIWQLSTASRRYSVFLYAHRLTPDSLFSIAGDIVAPKLEHEERQLTNLVQAGTEPSARERKAIAQQQAFVEELRAMLETLRQVAPLWRPTLDDGIVLVMAPLWRLVSHHKAWQRELKAKWSELAKGRYDWAALAMALWPERVVGKCATDRSLAIAHDLEDIFWKQDDDQKWHPRPEPTRRVNELVAERHSPAAQAALEEVGARAA
jgi:hypothetical protein